MLVEAVVILERRLDQRAVDLLLCVDRVVVTDLPTLVQVANEAGDAAVEVVRDLVVGPQVQVPVAAERYG